MNSTCRLAKRVRVSPGLVRVKSTKTGSTHRASIRKPHKPPAAASRSTTSSVMHVQQQIARRCGASTHPWLQSDNAEEGNNFNQHIFTQGRNYSYSISFTQHSRLRFGLHSVSAAILNQKKIWLINTFYAHICRPCCESKRYLPGCNALRVGETAHCRNMGTTDSRGRRYWVRRAS